MKIGVYTICKDEEKHVDQFMDSVRDADYITIADTGSTDRTVDRLKTRAIMLGKGWRQFAVHDISINPWRFDTARNVALSLAPTDIDVCIRLDMDEVLDPGWRKALEAAWNHPELTQLWYTFNHAPGYSFHANYIHARQGFVWRGMDHEGLYRATGLRGMTNFAKGLSITHHQDRSKPRTAILGRLETQVAEDKRARTLYYLGREYFYYNHSQKCVDTFMEYLKQPDAVWEPERMDSMSMVAESYFKLGNIGKAIDWYHRAIAEYNTREPMLGLAKLLAKVNNKAMAFGLVQQALRANNKLTNIFVKTWAWNDEPYILATQLANDLGLPTLAAEFASKMSAKPTRPAATESSATGPDLDMLPVDILSAA